MYIAGCLFGIRFFVMYHHLIVPLNRCKNGKLIAIVGVQNKKFEKPIDMEYTNWNSIIFMYSISCDDGNGNDF